MDNLYKTHGLDQPDICDTFSKLALETNSDNMTHENHDWQPPEFFKESLKKHLVGGNYQYSSGKGVPRLCEAIASFHEKPLNRKIDHLKEIFIANGDSCALHSTFIALLSKGDEVITLEPFQSNYASHIQLAGAKLLGVHLTPPKKREKSDYTSIKPGDQDTWTIDLDKLGSLLSNKTKIIILNTPHNPTGKILTYDELNAIAKLIENYPRIVVLMDETSEHEISDAFDELPRMQNVPGMYERTISVHCGGKQFSAPGLRIGWVIGPNHLIKIIFTIFQYGTFCMFEIYQQVIADCLVEANKPYEGYENYYKWVRARYSDLRTHFVQEFAKIDSGFDLFLPDGGYFLIGDITNTNQTLKYEPLAGDENTYKDSYYKDTNFLINLANEKKFVAIPCSALCTTPNKTIGQDFIRISFGKTKDSLNKALNKLR